MSNARPHPRPPLALKKIRRSVATVLAACALLAASACDDEQTPPFEVAGSGDVAGQLFFDADNNGIFSPFGGDTLLTDVEVRLLVRNDTTLIASTRTNDDGRFSFSGVSPGTHQLVVPGQAGITGSLVFCTLPGLASVYIGEQTYLAVPAKRGCVVRIAEAKNVGLNQSTTIAGIVTAAQGTYRGDNVYIQDPTGGIQIFGIPSLGLQLGDSIEVTGRMGQFREELQIVSPVVAPNVVRVTPLAPVVRTAKQITDAAALPGPKSPDVGQLVTVRRILQVGAFASGNATITDATGSIQLRLDGNVAAAIPQATFQAGKCYDITGILGYSFGILQLKPRAPSDVAEVTCPQ